VNKYNHPSRFRHIKIQIDLFSAAGFRSRVLVHLNLMISQNVPSGPNRRRVRDRYRGRKDADQRPMPTPTATSTPRDMMALNFIDALKLDGDFQRL